MSNIISFFQKLIKGGVGIRAGGGLENFSKINKRGGGRLFGTRVYFIHQVSRPSEPVFVWSTGQCP